MENEYAKSISFKEFYRKLSDVGSKIFPLPSQKLTSITSVVQTFVFDSVFTFIQDRLNNKFYKSGAEFPSYAKAMDAYMQNLELKRISNK